MRFSHLVLREFQIVHDDLMDRLIKEHGIDCKPQEEFSIIKRIQEIADKEPRFMMPIIAGLACIGCPALVVVLFSIISWVTYPYQEITSDIVIIWGVCIASIVALVYSIERGL